MAKLALILQADKSERSWNALFRGTPRQVMMIRIGNNEKSFNEMSCDRIFDRHVSAMRKAVAGKRLQGDPLREDQSLPRE